MASSLLIVWYSVCGSEEYSKELGVKCCVVGQETSFVLYLVLHLLCALHSVETVLIHSFYSDSNYL